MSLQVDAGANFIITQAIFSPDTHNAFLRRCRQAGIAVPILPGIWPFDTYQSLNNCANFCKLKVPDEIFETVEKYKTDPAAFEEYGTDIITNLVKSLLEIDEVVGVHFFSLNNISLVEKICKRLAM